MNPRYNPLVINAYISTMESLIGQEGIINEIGVGALLGGTKYGITDPSVIYLVEAAIKTVGHNSRKLPDSTYWIINGHGVDQEDIGPCLSELVELLKECLPASNPIRKSF